MILLLAGLARAGDPTADTLADGTVHTDVAVRFAAPDLPRWYDGEGYAAAFPGQWKAAGIAVCWVPVYQSVGATKVDFTVSFLVGADGHVSEIAVVEPVPAEVSTCLQLRSRDWVLPPAEKRPVRVKQPVSFSVWAR